MMPDLRKQGGFISWQLLKNELCERVDIIWWQSRAEAKQAAVTF
jgi:hypothetical protein